MTCISTKAALVSGGTDGIGRAVAPELARHGFALQVLGRDSAPGAYVGGTGESRPVDPGVVNTWYVKERNIVPRILARFMGPLETEQSGRSVVRHILNTRALEVAGKYFLLEEEKKPAAKLTTGEAAFRRLVAYRKQATGAPLAQIRAPAGESGH